MGLGGGVGWVWVLILHLLVINVIKLCMNSILATTLGLWVGGEVAMVMQSSEGGG